MAENISAESGGEEAKLSPELQNFRDRLLQEVSFNSGEADETVLRASAQAFYQDRATSPAFKGEYGTDSENGSALLNMSQSNRLFKELLAAEGFHKQTVSQVFTQEIQPLNNRVVEVTEELNSLRGTGEQPKGFAALEGFDESEVEKRQKIEALMQKQQRIYGSRLMAMRRIVEDPASYGLEPDKLGLERSELTRTVEEFASLLSNGDYENCFFINKIEMSDDNKLALSAQLIEKILPGEGAAAEARELLLEKCVKRIVYDIRDIRTNNKIPTNLRNKLLRNRNRDLARMLEDMTQHGKEGILKYGVFIMDGIDEGVAVKLPKLTLRLPEGVHRKINAIKDKNKTPEQTHKEVARVVNEFYRSLVTERYGEEKLDRLAASYSVYDEAGLKPNQLVGMEVRLLLERAGFSKEVMAKINEAIIADYFAKKSEYHAQFGELGSDKSAQVQKRALIKKVRRNRDTFENTLTDHLQNADFYEMMYQGAIELGNQLEDKRGEQTDFERIASLGPQDRLKAIDVMEAAYREEWQPALERSLETTLEEYRKDDEEINGLLKSFEIALEKMRQFTSKERFDEKDADRYEALVSDLDDAQAVLATLHVEEE